jgi:Spy/CpxP family protein refolding chaperone
MKTKSLINSVLGVGALLLVATFAPTTLAQSPAQDQATPPAASEPAARAHEHGKSPFAGLNLSDEQKTQIKKIHEAARAKRDKVMADSSLSDTAKHEKAREIRHAAMEQSRSVLTPEQREQLKANRSARRGERPQSPSM